MPLSWFWKQFKQMARSDQDWIKFTQFENSNLGPKFSLPNSRLNEHFQPMLPQKGSMIFGEGIPFDSIGLEEFIGIVLNKPLNLDWLIPSQQDPAPTWDEPRLKQLWSAIHNQDNLLIFSKSFVTK